MAKKIQRVIIAGCCGRMGKRISALAQSAKDISLAGGFEFPKHKTVGKAFLEYVGVGPTTVIGSSLSGVAKKGDVVIDFTGPESTIENVKSAARLGVKMVIGTTGLSKVQEKKIAQAAKKIPIVFAPNMSVGMNLMFKISQLVASVLDDGYDIEIVEAHHRNKKDAPSGTALGLAKSVAAGRKVHLEQKAEYGRNGMCGVRKKGNIGIHAIRGGDVVGDHTVSFMADGERIELTHKASSRDAFAQGAVKAASFLSKKRSGLFTMQDVLGLA